MKSIRLSALCAVIAAVAINVKADLCILGGDANENNVGSSSSPVYWYGSANWTPGIPGSGDSINWAPSKTGSHRHAYVELDNDCEIAELSANYRTIHIYKAPAAVEVSFTINTQLGGSGYQQCHEVNDGVKLVLPVGSTMICSAGDHNYSGIAVKSGGEVELCGALQTRVMKLEVEAGGTLEFDPSSYSIHSWGRSDNDHDEINVSGGMVFFRNGITMTGTASTPANQINQTGGTVEFYDNFTSETPWTYTWSAGMLRIVGSSTFGANIALVIPASSSVTLDVAPGQTFSAPGLSADPTSSITVIGGGTFSIAPTTVPIVIQNGSLGLATSGTYDLSNVSLGAGATASIALTALGATVNSLPSALADATFKADLSGAAAGTTVLNSSDATILEKAKTDLAASVPAGMALVVSGTTLSLEAQSSYVFTVSGDVLGAAGWGGAVPPAGADVAIDGQGVVATYSAGVIPAWASIEVKGGATLRIAASATPPPIMLNKSATLEIVNGAVVTLANASDLSGIATASQLPVLSITAGATLNVPGGMKFSNVDIVLAGTIAATTAGGITFGYAAAGETTYFGLAANGGTISIEPGSGSYNTSPLEFCCPAVGGAVNAVGSLTLANSTILPRYERSGTTYPLTVAYQIGFNLGVNNPAGTLFEVVFDNTQWGVLGSFYVKGGATFRLVNGGAYTTFESLGYWGRYGQISENGRLVVGSGCEFRMNAMGDYGSNPLQVNPPSAGHQAIIVEDGGVFENYRFSGNGRGVFVASNSVYRIYQPSIYDEHYSASSGTTTIYDTKNIPFEGFQSVEVAEGATLTFTTRNKVFWDSGQFDETSGDRVVALADVPITGGDASIVLSNANVNAFGVIVRSGANTATGVAGVSAPAAGVGATTLYFASGANWAGTVVADGNVALTNLVDASASSTNSFGTLRLDVDFPVRVWKENGAVVASDVLDVGAYAGTRRIVPVSAGGGELAAGDTIVLGKIAKGARPPRVARGWSATVREIAGDDANDELVLECGVGFRLILE